MIDPIKLTGVELAIIEHALVEYRKKISSISRQDFETLYSNERSQALMSEIDKLSKKVSNLIQTKDIIVSE